MARKHSSKWGGLRRGVGRLRQTRDQALLSGLPGRSKQQVAQHLAGEKIIRSPTLHNMEFPIDLLTGSIRDKPQPYYSRVSSVQFKNYEEAIEWWKVNRVEFLAIWEGPGSRPSIFWEMEFGKAGLWMSDMKQESYQYLDKHALWRPGEREKLIEWDQNKLPVNPLDIYPDLWPCCVHVHGYPYVFPEELGIEVRDGELYVNHCEWDMDYKTLDIIPNKNITYRCPYCKKSNYKSYDSRDYVCKSCGEYFRKLPLHGPKPLG